MMDMVNGKLVEIVMLLFVGFLVFVYLDDCYMVLETLESMG